jgi:hypothetical protein
MSKIITVNFTKKNENEEIEEVERLFRESHQALLDVMVHYSCLGCRTKFTFYSEYQLKLYLFFEDECHICKSKREYLKIMGIG